MEVQMGCVVGFVFKFSIRTRFSSEKMACDDTPDFPRAWRADSIISVVGLLTAIGSGDSSCEDDPLAVEGCGVQSQSAPAILQGACSGHHCPIS